MTEGFFLTILSRLIREYYLGHLQLLLLVYLDELDLGSFQKVKHPPIGSREAHPLALATGLCYISTVLSLEVAFKHCMGR